MKKITVFFLALLGTMFIYQSSNAQYCTSGATTTYDTSIDEVTLNGNSTNISNSTIGVCDDYSDFTALPAADLSPGQSYTVTIAMGSCSAYNYNKGASVFIDWNADFDFDDTGEGVGYTATTGSAAGSLSVTFTVPLTATTGDTRMRIVCQETSSPVNILACGTFSYGSTEDYTVSIQSLFACDLAVLSWDLPLIQSNDLTAAETVMVTIKNVGTAAQSNFSVWYSIDGGVSQTTELVTMSLPSGTTYQHTFAATANFSVTGVYDCEFGVTLACDSFLLNNATALQVTNASSITSFPYFQNFETPNFWLAVNGSWEQGTPSAPTINTAYSGSTVWATTLAGAYGNNEYSIVESPFFNFSSLTAPVVEFKMWHEIQLGNTDGAAFQYTIDGGATWNYVGIGLGALVGDPNGDNWYNAMSVEGLQYYNGWAGSTGGWITAKYKLYDPTGINLGSATGVKFRFIFGSNSWDDDDGFAFDDFMVYQSPNNDLRVNSVEVDHNCIGSLALSNVYIQVQNDGALDQSSYSVSYSIDGGATFVTESITNTISASGIYDYTFTTQADLTAPANYSIVGTVLLTGDQNTFNDTAYNSHMIYGSPVQQDFESWTLMQTIESCYWNYTAGADGDGWTQDQYDGGEWRLNEGSTGTSGTGPLMDYSEQTLDGNYLYLEGWCGGTVCNLISPCLDFAQDKYAVSFAYHMYGSEMGSLSIDVWDGTMWVNDVWIMAGDMGNQWYTASVNLAAFSNADAQVRFRGIMGNNTSDMAIDAIEFVALGPDDAGVIGFLPGTFCSGAVDVYAVIENKGNNDLASVNINWEVDGTAQTTVAYNTLMGLADIDTVLLGTFTFASATPYNINIWTSYPNANSDYNTSDDTLALAGVQTSLSGTYTLGATGDFANFGAAITNLNAFGVCGPVVFEVETGIYTEQIVLEGINGASAVNTITFTSATGDSTDVTLQYAASDYNSNWVVLFDGASYITFDALTLKTTASTYGHVIRIGGTSSYLTFRNNVIEALSGAAYDSYPFYYENTLDDYITIDNNVILNGYYGIYSRGAWGNQQSGNMITNNLVSGFYYYGIYMNNSKDFTIFGNKVETQGATGYSYGIYTTDCGGPFNISNNQVKILSGTTTYLMRINYTDTDTLGGLISNNMLSQNNHTGSVYGLYIYNSSNIKCYNNSVNINSGGTTYAFYLYHGSYSPYNAPPYYVDSKNNSFVNNQGGRAVYVSETSFLAGLFTSDHNNLYTSGTSLGTLGVASIPALVDWQTYYPGDVVSSNGAYTGLNDLHSNDVNLDGAAVVLAEVSDDIDGDMRDAATPDIGADEFTPQTLDVGISQLVSPVYVEGYCYGSEEIWVTLSNFGLDTIFFNIDSVIIQVDVAGPNPMFFENTYNVGYLEPGATVDVVISSNYDMSLGGIYLFDAATMVTNDGNTANDGVIVSINVLTVSTFPHMEDVESFSNMGTYGSLSNGWTADPATGYIYHWYAYNGDYWPPETGPSVDHTTGTSNGRYLTTYSSPGAIGDYAYMYPPCGDFAGKNFMFWYFMYGLECDSLVMEALIGNNWTVLWGEYGEIQTSNTDPWLQAVVTVPSNATQVRFKGKKGGYYGDYAIDDIMIFEPFANDVSLDIVYSMGELPLDGGAGHVASAIVTNWGYNNQVNLAVTLDVTGANTFSSTVVLPLLESYQTDTVYFDPFTAATAGFNTITASVPSDDNLSNNSKAYAQEITLDSYAYADTAASVGNAGNGGGEQLWALRHHIDGLKAVTAISAFITADNTIGQTVYGAVMDANFNILATTAPYIIQAADQNTYVTLSITDPSLSVMANTDFFAGFAQTQTGLGAYNPLGYQDEIPGRINAYYGTADLTGSGMTEFTNNRRFMVKAIISDPPPYDAAALAITAPAGACGMGIEAITTQIINNGSDTITSFDMSYLVLGGTSVTENVVYTLIPGQVFDYTFTANYDFSVVGADSTFEITSWVTLANDAVGSNDTIMGAVESKFIPVDPMVYNDTVPFGSTATLTMETPYNPLWFDDPNATNWIAIGDTFYTTGVLYDTTSYWAQATSTAYGDFVLGAGTSVYTGTSCNPYGQFYTSNSNQHLILASELLASGIVAGYINSLALNVSNPSNPTTNGANMDDYNIKMGHTSQSILNTASWQTAGMTQVFSAPNWPTVAGWNTHEFSDAFLWDGVSNIIVEFCFSNGTSNWSNNAELFADDLGFDCVIGYYTDGTFACGGPGTLFMNSSTTRPQMKLNATIPGCESNMVEVVAVVTGIPDYDGGVIAASSPVSGVELTMETVCVDIQNLGQNPISGFPITYLVSSGFSVQELVTATINPGDVYTYCFTIPVDLSAFGTYEICVFTDVTNDTYSANDTLCYIVVNDPIVLCVSTANYIWDTEIGNVQIGAWGNNSGTSVNGVLYTDFTGIAPAEVQNGMSYTMDVTSVWSLGTTWLADCYVGVYIDWNHDGILDDTSNELVFLGYTTSNNTVTFPLNVPATAASGTHNMRIVLNETWTPTNVSPCGTYNYGETEDYLITVLEPAPWDAGVLDILQPSGNLSEYDSEPVELVVFNFGSETITNMDIAYEVNGGTSTVFAWTGSLAQFETDTVLMPNMIVPGAYFDLCAFTNLLGDTTTINDTFCVQLYGDLMYEVAMNDIIAPEGGCDLGLEDIVVEFENFGDTIPPNTLFLSYTANGGTVITETYPTEIHAGDTTQYTFTTQLDMTVTVDTVFNIVAYTTIQGDINNYDDTAMVEVNSYLTPAVPSAVNATIWSGNFAELTIAPVDTNLLYMWYDSINGNLLSMGPDYTTPVLFDTTSYQLVTTSASYGDIQLGTGTIAYSGTSNNPYGQYYTSNNNQFIILATELQALGFAAGSINSLAIDVVNPTSATTQGNNMNNYSIKMGHTSMSTMPGNWLTGLTEVFLAPNWPTVTGWNTHEFDTPFEWDGSSNVVVEFCFSNGLSNWSSNASIKVTNLGFTCGHGINTDGAYNCGSPGTLWMTSTTSRPNMLFNATIPGCDATPVEVTAFVQYADYDAAVWSIISPLTGSYLGFENVVVEIYNNGLNAISNIPVNYSLNAGTPVQETILATLQPGDNYVYTFTTQVDLSLYASYDLCVYTSLANDGYTLNDNICEVVVNMNGDGFACATALPYGLMNDPAVMSSTTYAYDFEWWSFDVISDAENVVISLCGSSFDTKLEVWDDCNGLAFIYSNDNDPTGVCSPQSVISIPTLLTGTYYVKVLGSSASHGDFTLEITGDYQPVFDIVLAETHVSCFGGNDGQIMGSIVATSTGSLGVAPYYWNWAPISNTNQNVTNLTAGWYYVTVTDATGWMETAEVEITEPTALVLTGTFTNVTTLGGNDGSVEITVSGGVTPYTYQWSNGASTEDVSALYAGTHVVTVTDDNNCDYVASYSLVSPIPANWNNIPTNVSHEIEIPFNASIMLDNVPVSPGSLVGVFYDSLGTLVCGGYTFWSGMDESVIAFGTEPAMNNGFAPGEIFKWKVYDAGLSVEYGGSAIYNTVQYPNAEDFVINGLSGVTNLNFFSIITQNIQLPAGWSIWSTYINPTDPIISAVMADIVAPPFTLGDVEIVKNGGGQIYWPFYNLNTIGNIAIGEGYQVKINGAVPVIFGVTGLQIMPEFTPFNIPNGWSIIGYLRSDPADMALMLAPIISPPFTPGIVEIVKNGAGQIFWPFYGLNTIGNMIPGEGYQIKLNAEAPGFSYPANVSANSKAFDHSFHSPVKYETVAPSGDNMTIGIPEKSWLTKPATGDEIGIFNGNDELIGSAVYEGGFTAITVWGAEMLEETDKGSNGMFVTMKLWNSETGIEHEVVFESWKQGSDEYISNAINIAGKVALAGTVNEYVLGQNMPNPFNGSTRIPFYLPEDCDVTIAVYNAIGELVKEVISENRAAGSHVVEFDGTKLESGNYFYKLVTDKYTSTKPMSIR
jgi:parallel beta-helix repeat protein